MCFSFIDKMDHSTPPPLKKCAKEYIQNALDFSPLNFKTIEAFHYYLLKLILKKLCDHIMALKYNYAIISFE